MTTFWSHSPPQKKKKYKYEIDTNHFKARDQYSFSCPDIIRYEENILADIQKKNTRQEPYKWPSNLPTFEGNVKALPFK